MSPRALLLVQVVAALLVLVVVLAVVELVSGFLVGGSRGRFPVDTFAFVKDDPVSGALALLNENPVPMQKSFDLLWRLEPNGRRTEPVNPRHFGHDDRWSLAINSEGFRGPERGFRGRHADVYRILCIGDSITFGFNVDQPDVYPARLQALLNARYPERRFEVVNAAVPGWTWIQGLRYVDLEGLALEPDLVVEAHGTNDRFFDAKITDTERIGVLQSPWVRAMQRMSDVLDGTNTYRLVRQLTGRPLRERVNSRGCDRQLREFGVCRRVALDEMAEAIAEVNRRVTARGAAMLVLNLDFIGTDAVNVVRPAAGQSGIPFVDVVAVLAEMRRRDEDERAHRLGLALAAERPFDPRSRREVLFRVVAPPESKIVTVRGRPHFEDEHAFDEPLYDDGTHGDERAGDRVFSARVAPLGRATEWRYEFYADGIREFEPLPPIPSRQGDRLLVLKGSAVLPVAVFGEYYLMSERTHPDAPGHALIAERLLEALPGVDSFRRFVGPS